MGKSSESVQCAITGPCLRMRHRPSAYRTVPIRKICPKMVYTRVCLPSHINVWDTPTNRFTLSHYLRLRITAAIYKLLQAHHLHLQPTCSSSIHRNGIKTQLNTNCKVFVYFSISTDASTKTIHNIK